jgi:hypothetical protein
MNRKAELAFLYQFLVYLVLGMGEKLLESLFSFQIDQQLTIQKNFFAQIYAEQVLLIHHLKMGIGIIIMHKIKHIL